MSLGDLADVQMGYSFRTRVESDPLGNVAVIQMKDIDDANQLLVEQATRVVLPGLKAQHLLRPGDLLFRSRGRSNGVAEVAGETGPAVLAAPMLLIRPHSALSAYLSWYINAPSTQAQLAALSEGTSVRMISAEALKALEVPVPTLSVQQLIVQAAAQANREQALLARIANLRRRITEYQLMKLVHEAAE